MALIDEVKIIPSPDFSRFLKTLKREDHGVVPLYEFFADKPIKDKIMGKPTLLPMAFPLAPDMDEIIRNDVEFWYRLGYDYVPSGPPLLNFFSAEFIKDTAELSMGARMWITEKSSSRIGSREDFDKFPWPDPEKIDFTVFDMIPRFLPEGMGLIAQGQGILEPVMWSMGHEGMAYALADDPELVKMTFDRVGRIMTRFVERMAERDFVGAIEVGDDMGFKTGTMISPSMLREYVLPWHKKMADKAHERGKPYILHSCGNLEAIMDDLIDFVGVDAKHSFEDVIMPVAKVKERWGSRTAILGGVDMDFLTRSTPEQVRSYSRKVLEDCAPGGGYALGCGNTVANYVPPQNFLAMIEEGWKFNEK